MDKLSFTRICAYAGCSQAEIARKTGLSRQAVSLWSNYNASFVPIRSDHLLKLADCLEVSADTLLRPLASEDWWNRQSAELLWDRLYPNLSEFLRALVRSEDRAVGRLVDIYGLFAAEKIIGKQVWISFSTYSRWIPPLRRKELEILCQTQKDLQLI